MPRRKRCHGRKKNNKEKSDTSLEKKPSAPQTSRFQSQQVTPTSTSQVSTPKPAQYEKGTVQSSTAAATVKSGTTPATPAAPSGASAAGAAGGGGFTSTQKGPSQVTPQVQVEVGPPGAKVSTEELDPFDALSGTLQPSQPVAPKVPVFTGPEVREEKKTPAGVPEKPKDVPKPISTDEALDSLSAGFVSSAPAPKKTDVKTETIGAVDVRSAGMSNFAPPPPSQQQKQPTTSQPATVTKSPAPPADKKPRIDTPAQPAKPKTDATDNSMSLDALSALGDTLGAPEPPKKLPELKPGQIVDEKKVKSEKGVRVGEREDTLPPGYRFTEEELMKYPPPEKQPSLSSDDALDILSEGFTEPAAAPVVKAPVPPAQETKKPAGVPEKTKDVSKAKVDESALDALASDFVAPAQSAPKVSSSAPKTLPPQTSQTDEDALSALGDTLGAPEPPKKEPELKPKDIVHEKDVTSEKGVRVGEREDTLPPGYRFTEEELKKYPPPPKEPSLSSDDALDILSGGFTEPAAAPVVKAPVPPAQKEKKPEAVPEKTKDVPKETKKPAGVPEKTKDVPKPSDCDLALDALGGDFVAPSSASKVQSAVSGPPHTDRQLSEGTSSALDALSDTLADIKPAPEPAPVSPKDVVKEKNVVEEKVSKPGERDDTLPPDRRFTEEDRKAFEAAKQKDVKPKRSSIDDTTALDLLSSEFSAVPPVKPSAPDAQRFIPEPQPPTFKASGPVFDELAEKVIPNLTDPKAKESKPKGKGAKPKSKQKKQTVEDSSATEKQPGKPSSDVVPSSSTKSGNR